MQIYRHCFKESISYVSVNFDFLYCLFPTGIKGVCQLGNDQLLNTHSGLSCRLNIITSILLLHYTALAAKVRQAVQLFNVLSYYKRQHYKLKKKKSALCFLIAWGPLRKHLAPLLFGCGLLMQIYRLNTPAKHSGQFSCRSEKHTSVRTR